MENKENIKNLLNLLKNKIDNDNLSSDEMNIFSTARRALLRELNKDQQTKPPRYFIQQLRCKNDTNGNPRRIYMCHDLTHDRVDYFDEGYCGIDTVPLSYRENYIEGRSADLSPSEYKQLKKIARESAYNDNMELKKASNK